jgi:hypothetical protein
MKATLVKQLQYHLTGGGAVSIAVELDADGVASFVSHTIGKRAPQEFRGDEITTTPSEEGTRVTVLLENGAADGPIVRLTVIVPEVVPGDESSFKVTAAALRTTEQSLFGGPRPGPRQTYEALSLKGKVTIAGGETGTCHDWLAIHDFMPGHPAKLTVTGTCTFPTAGFKVELRRTQPQGINPLDLLLDKIVTPPRGPAADVVTDVEARYEEVTNVKYKTVTILPDGPSIPVENAL